MSRYLITMIKKPFSIIRNVLAILGGLTIVALIVIWIISPNYDVEVYKNNIGLYKNRLKALRSSGEYAADTNVFSMQIIQDSTRAKEIRDYFSWTPSFLRMPTPGKKPLQLASSLPRISRTTTKGYGRHTVVTSRNARALHCRQENEDVSGFWPR